MEAKIHITASTSIRNFAIHHNGSLIYENSETSISEFLLSAYRNSGISYPKFYKMDNLSKLGWLSAEYLMEGRAIVTTDDKLRSGIVLANSSSSLDTDIRYQQTISEIPSPALFVYTLPNIVIGEISIRHGFKGENAFFIFDEFNASFISDYVNDLFDSDLLDRCICGWVEIFEEEHDACLMLAERNTGNDYDLPFNAKNIQDIYNFNNG